MMTGGPKVGLWLVALIGCGAEAPPGSSDPRARMAGSANTNVWTGQEDTVVSDPTRELTDPEFDALTDRFVWSDAQFRVWLGYVDPATGAFQPPDGRAVLIDDRGADYALLVNGPEWLYTDEGNQVLYTQERAGINHLATATLDQGQWVRRRLYQGQNRVAGTGSLTPGDPTPHLTFLAPDGEHLHWRDIEGTEHDVLGPMKHTLSAPRFVDGEDLIIWSIPIDGVDQVILVDLVTGVEEQLTFDAIGHIEPYLVQVPELNELVFVATRLNQARQPVALDVYRESGGVWNLHHQIYPPRLYPFVQSPEPMVANGASYVSYIADKLPDRTRDGDGVAWLVGLLPTNPVDVRVSDSTPMRRKDPETFVGDGVAWLYYTDASPGQIRNVHRCLLPVF